MTISRTVIRELSDGKQIKVTRRYAVQFEAEEGGYRLNGKLIDVKVEVPEIISGLAEIERKRDDSDMFPIHVDAQGAIRQGEGAGAGDPGLREEMRAKGSALLAASGVSPAVAEQGMRLVNRTLQAKPGSPWPTDLFRIEPGEHRVSRVVPLQGGAEGRIEVVTQVDALLPCGLPQTVKRTITTLLAGNRKVSHEIWSFALATA